MSDHTETNELLWAEAAGDIDDARRTALLDRARQEAAGPYTTLIAARDAEDFENRLEVVRGALDMAVMRADPQTADDLFWVNGALVESIRRDHTAALEAEAADPQPQPQPQPNPFPAKTAGVTWHPDSGGASWGDYDDPYGTVGWNVRVDPPLSAEEAEFYRDDRFDLTQWGWHVWNSQGVNEQGDAPTEAAAKAAAESFLVSQNSGGAEQLTMARKLARGVGSHAYVLPAQDISGDLFRTTKLAFKVGDRVVFEGWAPTMDGSESTDLAARVWPGTLGTVVDTGGQSGVIGVAWDTGEELGMLPGDRIRLARRRTAGITWDGYTGVDERGVTYTIERSGQNADGGPFWTWTSSDGHWGGGGTPSQAMAEAESALARGAMASRRTASGDDPLPGWEELPWSDSGYRDWEKVVGDYDLYVWQGLDHGHSSGWEVSTMSGQRLADGYAAHINEAMNAAEDFLAQQVGVTAMRRGAPFAGYDDFDDCVSKNSDKDDPEAYCGKIKHQVEDKKGSRRTAALFSMPKLGASNPAPMRRTAYRRYTAPDGTVHYATEQTGSTCFGFAIHASGTPRQTWGYFDPDEAGMVRDPRFRPTTVAELIKAQGGAGWLGPELPGPIPEWWDRPIELSPQDRQNIDDADAGYAAGMADFAAGKPKAVVDTAPVFGSPGGGNWYNRSYDKGYEDASAKAHGQLPLPTAARKGLIGRWRERRARRRKIAESFEAWAETVRMWARDNGYPREGISSGPFSDENLRSLWDSGRADEEGAAATAIELLDAPGAIAFEGRRKQAAWVLADSQGNTLTQHGTFESESEARRKADQVDPDGSYVIVRQAHRRQAGDWDYTGPMGVPGTGDPNYYEIYDPRTGQAVSGLFGTKDEAYEALGAMGGDAYGAFDVRRQASLRRQADNFIAPPEPPSPEQSSEPIEDLGDFVAFNSWRKEVERWVLNRTNQPAEQIGSLRALYQQGLNPVEAARQLIAEAGHVPLIVQADRATDLPPMRKQADDYKGWFIYTTHDESGYTYSVRGVDGTVVASGGPYPTHNAALDAGEAWVDSALFDATPYTARRRQAWLDSGNPFGGDNPFSGGGEGGDAGKVTDAPSDADADRVTDVMKADHEMGMGTMRNLSRRHMAGDVDDDDLDGWGVCPVCAGPGEPMGTLGRLEWLRCRNCGMEWSRDSSGQVTSMRRQSLGGEMIYPEDGPEEGSFVVYPGGYAVDLRQLPDWWEGSRRPDISWGPFSTRTEVRDFMRVSGQVTSMRRQAAEWKPLYRDLGYTPSYTIEDAEIGGWSLSVDNMTGAWRWEVAGPKNLEYQIPGDRGVAGSYEEAKAKAEQFAMSHEASRRRQAVDFEGPDNPFTQDRTRDEPVGTPTDMFSDAQPVPTDRPEERLRRESPNEEAPSAGRDPSTFGSM